MILTAQTAIQTSTPPSVGNLSSPQANTPAIAAPANGNAQAVLPELAVHEAKALSAASDITLKHSENKVETNKTLEVKLARVASESVAAHRTVDALLKNVIGLCEAVDGELPAKFAMMNVNSGAEGVPSFTVVGQVDTPAFQKLLNDVKHDRATPQGDGGADGAHAADHLGKSQSSERDLNTAAGRQTAHSDQPWTLREKGTAYFNLTNSNYFKGVLTKIKDEQTRVQTLKTELEKKQLDPEKNSAYVAAKSQLSRFEGLIDLNRLSGLRVSSEAGSRGGLQLYPGVNESKALQTDHPDYYETQQKDGKTKNPAALSDGKKGSLSAYQNDFRATPKPADVAADDKRAGLTDKGKVWVSAEQLLQEGRLTERELRVADYNPRNRLNLTDLQFPERQTAEAGAISEHAVRDLSQTVVQRGNGFAVWSVSPGTGFAKDAAEHAKPVVAGPSGTTDRFIGAARLLAPGVKSELGLETDKQLLELTRWVATGYLVDDNHHSMVEVSLGAANHGLKAQWGVELYTEPFSTPIHAKGFDISSSQVLEAFGDKPDPNVSRDYQRNLVAGLEWKVGSQAKQEFELNIQASGVMSKDKEGTRKEVENQWSRASWKAHPENHFKHPSYADNQPFTANGQLNAKSKINELLQQAPNTAPEAADKARQQFDQALFNVISDALSHDKPLPNAAAIEELAKKTLVQFAA